jgi:benzylsuccinate synthase
MPTCKECKSYFELKAEPDKGDCVQRVVDPRQAYYRARPVKADQEALSCAPAGSAELCSFQKR